MSTETVTIASLGAEGDGIAHTASGTVYVPFALPGEVAAIARVRNHGTIMSLSVASPDRREPPCRHFGPDAEGGACGGCSLQHYADAPYRAFKRALVADALKAKGLDTEVGALIPARPGERRRTVFTLRRTEKDMLLGFNQAGSHHIIAIAECPIAAPGIVARLADIRAIAASLATGPDPFRVTVLETSTGLDLGFEGIRKAGDRERRAMTQTVLKLRGIARVSLDGEILIEPVKPLIDFGGIPVVPPPAGFTQATRPAEDAMAELVLGHLSKAKKVADLFAGAGTFALRLARRTRVHAVEGDGKALAALDHAARNTQGLKPVTVEKRDLFRRPLMTSELKAYDGLVFDPPRAGAEAQVKELVRSGISRVAAVSCNPLTLARDLKLLTDGGYRINSVTPIDQFLWSTHVETVALLSK
ncbi:class I SAM-dependent RNA methyltransferase [Rhizobiaceae bacterium BDR2-2]|uniref:Class I SAM-dependent RNA methyltransferase n=1 Tax=Ectorhizobium quercum TaxID=2965071 RepID=A0AAE3SUX4_9HYPH|nr:class I SAM-dependent RNA methyltransferase [Ectorhizobium quercum]MCX8996354.1 class I SAM-dependent RNA methyltransferase [Ectorhizobium quercum]MCX8998607.1 class I SAM-dependent RNA methyltransferase [Ectorhizobium quercum]